MRGKGGRGSILYSLPGGGGNYQAWYGTLGAIAEAVSVAAWCGWWGGEGEGGRVWRGEEWGGAWCSLCVRSGVGGEGGGGEGAWCRRFVGCGGPLRGDKRRDGRAGVKGFRAETKGEPRWTGAGGVRGRGGGGTLQFLHTIKSV